MGVVLQEEAWQMGMTGGLWHMMGGKTAREWVYGEVYRYVIDCEASVAAIIWWYEDSVMSGSIHLPPH